MSSIFKIGGAPCGISAELRVEVTPNGLDGRRWEFVISEGESERSGVIRADLPASVSRGERPSKAELEATIESLAGHFPVESRFEDMLGEYEDFGPYRMMVEDFGLTAFRRRLVAA